MAIVLGLDAILMRGPAGTTGSTEVKNVKDLTLNLESGDADVTTRATKGWRASVATLKEASLEFNILYDTEDEDYNAFADAYFNNTPMALFVTDGNGTGLDADFSITGFSIEQPLEEALSHGLGTCAAVDQGKRRRCRRIRASVSPYAGNQSSKEQLTHENFHGQYRPNLDALGHGRHDQTGARPLRCGSGKHHHHGERENAERRTAGTSCG